MERISNSRKFTQELLKTLSERDGATVLETYSKLTSKTIIKYRCACGQEGSKSYSIIPEYKMICRKCINITMLEKTKATNIQNYGCEDPNQLPEMKEKIKKVFIQKYGVDSPMKTDTIKDKIKQVFVEKYGVENPFQNDQIKTKITNTFKEKYGVEHALQCKKFHDKFKQTLNERYGVDIPYHSIELKERGKQTCLQKYGVEYSLQNDEVREKGKQTCLQKYGVEFAIQNNIIQQNIQTKAKRYKQYVMPSGKIRNIQGYEPFALKILLEQYSEDQILTDRKDIPHITYYKDNIKKYYFPDIFIPHENKIIEVKSTWTYSSKSDNISLKSEATSSAGYIYEIWVFDNKGNLVDRIKN